MKSARLAIAAVAAILALVLAAGCGGSKSKSSGAATGAATVAAKPARSAASPILIGAVVGKTGFLNAFDVPPYQASQLAVADINAKGGVLGHKLKLIFADSKSDKVEAGSAADRLLDQGAKFIIAPCDFDYGGAAAIEAQKRNIPAMSDCAGTVQFGVQGIGPYAFTMGNSNAGYLSAMAEWAYKAKKWRNAYILQDDSIEYHKQGCKAFNAAWQALGGKVVRYDHFQNSDPSISSQITRIKSATPAPDFIVECSHPPGAITALRQIRAGGVSTPIVGEGQSFDGTYWFKTVPGLTNFFYPTNGLWNGHDPRPFVNSLVKRIEKKFGGQVVSSTVLEGYSVIQAYAAAAQKAHSTDPAAIRAALEKFRNVPLLVGPTSFSSTLHMSVKRRYAILEVTGNKDKFITFWTPKSIPPMSAWAAG